MTRPALLTLLLLAGCAPAALTGGAGPEASHGRLLTLDTHLDTPLHFARKGWSFGDRHTLSDDLVQLDLPRMKDGALDGGFFVIYTDQGPLTAEGYAAAHAHAIRRSDEIDATLARFPDQIAPARTADDADRLNRQGRLIAYKSIENSYPLGEDLARLTDFKRRGVTLIGPVHSTNNQFADSATDEPRWNGLSPLGRQWVAEMNRLGLVIDASHASDVAFDQMVVQSKAPILLSHSGARAVFDHPRNLDDDRLRVLAASGGAICMTTVYLSPMRLGPERAALFADFERIGQLTATEQEALTRRWRALDEVEPLWAAGFEDFIGAVLHAIRVAGIDHVCIGADWDGGGGIEGLQDITAFPAVSERLRQMGLSDADLGKLWSGNVLRVLAAAQRVGEDRSNAGQP